MRRGILEADCTDKKEFVHFIHTVIAHLVKARSTEPMLQNGMKHALWTYEKLQEKSLPEIVQGVNSALEELLTLIDTGDSIRARFGADIIQD